MCIVSIQANIGWISPEPKKEVLTELIMLNLHCQLANPKMLIGVIHHEHGLEQQDSEHVQHFQAKSHKYPIDKSERALYHSNHTLLALTRLFPA